MKKKLLIYSLTAMLLASSASAATISKISFQNQTLTVKGQADGTGKVTLRVLKPGMTAEQLESLPLSEQMAAISYLKQEEPGAYTFEYSPKSISVWGNYNIYVTDSTGDTKHEYQLIAEEGTLKTVVNALNQAKTAAEVKQVLEQYPELLSGVTAIETLKAQNPELLDSAAALMVGLSYQNANEIVVEAIRACVVAEINRSETAAGLAGLISTYQKELALSENQIYLTYFTNPDYANKISEKLLNRNDTSYQAFYRGFLETILLDQLNAVKNYTENEQILTAGQDYLTAIGFDYAGFDKLSNKDFVYRKLAERSDYKTIDEVQTVFLQAVKDAGKNSSSGDSGNSGNSSRSDSSSGSTGSGNVIGVSKTAEPEKIPFSDLGSVEWAKESILALYQKGIVSGMSEDTFEPQGLVTREQFAKMLVLACGLYQENAVCTFSDVPDGAWYQSYVASAAASGIVFGMDEEHFGVGQNITREDMAVMVYRAAKKTGKLSDAEQGTVFADENEISDYAKEAVNTLKARGIMSGKGENRFEPKAYATRAEAAKMIHGLIQ